MAKCIAVIFVIISTSTCSPLGHTICETQNVLPGFLPKPTTICESSVLPLIALLSSLNLPLPCPCSNYGLPYHETMTGSNMGFLGYPGMPLPYGNTMPPFPLSPGQTTVFESTTNMPVPMPTTTVCETSTVTPFSNSLNLPITFSSPSNSLPSTTVCETTNSPYPLPPTTICETMPNVLPYQNMPMLPLSNLPVPVTTPISSPLTPSTTVCETTSNMLPVHSLPINLPLPGLTGFSLPNVLGGYPLPNMSLPRLLGSLGVQLV